MPAKTATHKKIPATQTTETATSPPATVGTPPVTQSPTATPNMTVPRAVLPNPGPVAPAGTVAFPAAAAPPAAPVASPSVPSALEGPPAVTIPAVPAGYVVANRHTVMGFYPNATELAAAPQVVTDLGNFADYLTVLGTSAPEASALAGSVTVGINWRNLRNACEAFTAYVKSQDALAWKAAFVGLDELKPLFLIAATKNPTLATTYAGLAAMFDAPKVIARSGAVTRKKTAKTKASAAATAAVAAKAAEAVAPPQAASAQAVTPKSVTVNA